MGLTKNESKVYLKVSIAIILCVVSAILITSSILYINFQSILMKHEYETYLEKMESESAQRQKLSNIALNILFQITNDLSVTKLLTYNHLNAVDENAAFIQLRHFLVTIPNVDSIYVYNMKNDLIYNVTNESDLIRPWSVDYYKKSNFYDSSAVQMIENCSDYVPYIAVPRYYRVNESYTKCVYTYIMYDIFNKSNNSNVIMLNLEEDYLFGKENLKKLDTTSLILDRQNNIIYSNSEQFKILDRLADDFDTKGIMEKEVSGYFITQVNEEKSVVIFTETDKYGWRYVSILPYNKLLSQVNKLQSTIIFVSIIICITGVFAAFICSQRVSTPIRHMSADIKNLRSERKQTETITKKIKVKEFLDNGVEKSGGSQKAGEDLLSYLDFSVGENRSMVLLSICMDDYGYLLENIGVEVINAYKFAAVNIFNELLGEDAGSYCLDISIDKNLLFINMDNDFTMEKLDEHIRQMQKLVSEFFKVTVTVAISDYSSNPGMVYGLYEQIKESLSRSIFWSKGDIIHYSDLKIKAVDHYEYPENKERTLIEYLTYGKALEAKTIYLSMVSETYSYPIVIYNMVISRLVFVISNVINIISKNSSAYSLAGSILISSLLQEYDKIEERNEKFYDLFLQIQREVENKKSDRKEQIISNINRRIETDYSDAALSIEVLAEEVGMSAAYICRIYKQYTGNTINEVLLNQRMEKARQLLTQSSASINTIAEKVGFTGSSYFYRAFKKVNGVTPNEYRKT